MRRSIAEVFADFGWRVVARLVSRCDICGLKSPSHKMDCSGSYRSVIGQGGWGS